MTSVTASVLLGTLVIVLLSGWSVEGTATIHLTVSNFSNPTNRLYNDECCQPSIECHLTCNVVYVVCFGSSWFDEHCTEPPVYSYDSIPFTVQHRISSLMGASVKVVAYDVSEGWTSLIDYFNANINDSRVSSLELPSLGTRTTYTTTLTAGVNITCNRDYYGPQCDRYCRARDNCNGHYTCNPLTGAVECLPGWTGSSCTVIEDSGGFCPTLPRHQPLLTSQTCAAIDLVFVVGISQSQSDFYSTYSHPFMVSTIDRVSVGESEYKFAVVTFNDRAALSVELGASNESDIYDQLPTTARGRGINLREALFVARTRAFDVDNGMRPLAYKAVVVLWDGQAPDEEFGTLVDEAPRLKTELAADVYVIVSAEYASASRSLVETIASQPYGAHTRSNSWRTVENGVANVLLNVDINCQRTLTSSTTDRSGTVSSPTAADGSSTSRSTPNAAIPPVTSTTSPYPFRTVAPPYVATSPHLLPTAGPPDTRTTPGPPTGLPTSRSIPVLRSTSSTAIPRVTSTTTAAPSSPGPPTAKSTDGPPTMRSTPGPPTLISTAGPPTLESTSDGAMSDPPLPSTPGINTTLGTGDPFCSDAGMCSSSAGSCCCFPGYAGENCQYLTDPCSSMPCVFGHCTIISMTSYRCICPPGIWGANCENVGSVTRTCPPPSVSTSFCEAVASTPCAEFHYDRPDCNVFCRPTDSCVGHYTCSSNGDRVCLPGWTGSNCTVNVATQSSECTCRNGGTWLDGVCVGEMSTTASVVSAPTAEMTSRVASTSGTPSVVTTPTAADSSVPTTTQSILHLITYIRTNFPTLSSAQQLQLLAVLLQQARESGRDFRLD